MSYTLRDHTADVAVEATGGTLGHLFAAVADGMAAAQCEEIPEVGGQRHEVSVTAEGQEALLFDYLDHLIYERDVERVLPVDNEAIVRTVGADEQDKGEARLEHPDADPDEERDEDGDEGPPEEDGEAWHLEGSYRGIPLGDVVARDLKAVTYSEMAVEKRAEGWYAYVVFDV